MTAASNPLGIPIWCLYLLAFVACLCVYGGVLASSLGGDLGFWLPTLASSLIPLLIFGAVVRLYVLRVVHPAGTRVQAILHLVGGAALSIALFLILMALLGLRTGEAMNIFGRAPFRGPAAIWQAVQCASFYGVVAILAEFEKSRSPIASADTDRQPASESDQTSGKTDQIDEQRIFVRDGDEFVPLRTDRIVRIGGARDYAEVVTRVGTHLLRTSLTELEEKLGPNFLRVHRSTIVNIDQIERLEPAGGGRLHLHLLNGDTVDASRTGAKRIRERVV